MVQLQEIDMSQNGTSLGIENVFVRHFTKGIFMEPRKNLFRRFKTA